MFKICSSLRENPRAHRGWRIALAGLWLMCAVFLHGAAFRWLPTRIWGDWQEYLMMQVGIAEYGRLSVVPEAAEKADHYVQEADTSARLLWRADFEKLAHAEIPAVAGAYRSPRNGKYYFGHFFFYNILTVPAHYLCLWLDIPPFRAMTLTNVWIWLAVLAYVLLENRFPWKARALAFALGVLSPMAWYLDFKGPELLTQAGIFAAVLSCLARRPFLSITCTLVAALQNPSAAAWMIVPLWRLVKEKNYLKLVKGLILASLVWLPSAFYMYLFNTPNVLASSFLQTENITLSRLWSAYLDLQQGLILGYPLAFPIFLIWALVRAFKKDFEGLAWLGITVLMWLPLLSQSNWHPGQIRMLRYGAWIGLVFQAGLVGIYLQTSKNIFKYLLSVVLGFNIWYFIATGFIFQQNYYYCDFNSAVRWVFRNRPSWYNPDIEIFAECVLKFEKDFTQDSILIYRDPKSGAPLKVAIKKGLSDSFLRNSLDEHFLLRNPYRSPAGRNWFYLNP
ncbi:MAG: hypothetical protein N2050_09125 [Flavobacteriales bacterium]|nr:hypothetical protein [Flavobacteriales bacterium]